MFDSKKRPKPTATHTGIPGDIMTPLSLFFRRYSHFLTGGILSLLLGFITFPILTRILTHEQYGMLGLVTTSMFLLVAIAKAGLSDGIVRFYKEYSEPQKKLNIFVSTLAVRGAVLAVVTVLLYVSILKIISSYVNIDRQYITCFYIMALYLFIRPLNIIVLNVLKVIGKTVFFNSISLISKIISIALSLSILLFFVRELYGYFIGVVLSEFVLLLILFHWFFSHYRINLFKASGSLASKLIIFGAPLLLTELSYLLLSYADRYMIAAYRGANDLGLYSVGYNLANYISELVTFSLSYAIVPMYVEIYEKEGKDKTEQFLNNCMHYLCIAIIPVCIGYLAVSKDLFAVLASDTYADAANFSPLILFGALLLGMNNLLNAGLYLQKKSSTILGIMLAAVVINIIANVVLLPIYGIVGSAIATLIACVAATALTVYLSYRYITVRLDLKSISYYVAFSVGMFLIIQNIQTPMIWINLIAKIIAGMLIMCCGVLLRERDLRDWIKEIYQLKNA
jgi:O-antigen/teichoic acid export membrane protein